MAGGINAGGWSDYVRDLNRVLVAGGWCQMVEIYFNAQSNNGALTDGEIIPRALPRTDVDIRSGRSRPSTLVSHTNAPILLQS